MAFLQFFGGIQSSVHLADSSDAPADDVATVSDSSDESSSSSSSSSSEETDQLPQSKKSKVATMDPLGPAEEALIGLHRRTWHIMVPSPIEKIIFTNLAKSGVEDGMWPLSFPGHGASRFGAQNWCKSSVVQSRRLPQRVPQHWIAQLNLRSVVQQKRIGALVENPPPKKKA